MRRENRAGELLLKCEASEAARRTGMDENPWSE